MTEIVKGMGQLKATLKGFQKTFGSPRPVLEVSGAIMKKQAARSFEKQADPVTGAPWKRHSAVTTRARRGSGEGDKLLYDTGRLLRSILACKPTITTRSVSVFTNVIYAHIQNEGGTIRPVKAKWLTIPLLPECRRYKGAREWMTRNAAKKPHFVFPAGKNFGLIVAEEGPKTRRRSTAYWLLVKKVVIPQRRFMALEDPQAAEIDAAIMAMVTSGWNNRTGIPGQVAEQ